MRRTARLPVREIDLQDALDRRAIAPLVSVVIPVYNQGQYLAAAIESVLAQKYEPIELIVVDDGSSDDTPAVISQYVDRISSIRQSNHGASHALNHGIQASQGSLVCWLSADDEFLPGKLHAQVEAFAVEPELWLCSTGFDVVDAAGNMVRRNPTTRWRHPDPFVAVLWENPINGSTVMVRREVFDQVGFFDTSLRADVDADMWLRIAPFGRIVQLQGAFLRYRVHGASLSANRPLMIDSMTRVRLPHVESGRLRSRLGTGREAAEFFPSWPRNTAGVGSDASGRPCFLSPGPLVARRASSCLRARPWRSRAGSGPTVCCYLLEPAFDRPCDGDARV